MDELRERILRALFAAVLVAGSLAATRALAQVAEIEPNDLQVQATEVPWDGDDVDATGEMSSLFDVDFFVFTGLSVARTYHIESDAALGLGVYDENGELQQSIANEFAQPLFDELVPEPGGRIFVAVCGFDLIDVSTAVYDCDTPSQFAQGLYVLTLPEPGGPGLAALVALAVLARGRRRASRRHGDREPRASARAAAPCAMLPPWADSCCSSSSCPPSSWRC